MDFKGILLWLKLKPTQRTLGGLALIIVILWRMFKAEQAKNDFYRNRADSLCKEQQIVNEEKIRVRDSVIAAKNSEIQLIYKTQAEELRKATRQVEAIRENSKLIKQKTENLAK